MKKFYTFQVQKLKKSYIFNLITELPRFKANSWAGPFKNNRVTGIL